MEVKTHGRQVNISGWRRARWCNETLFGTWEAAGCQWNHWDWQSLGWKEIAGNTGVLVTHSLGYCPKPWRHNSIQVTQSMWISNAPLMLQVKEMRVGQMGWGLENQRSGHWAGSSALPLSKLEYCIFSSNILHSVQYNQMIYIEVEYASVITGKRCWRHDSELELWCGGMDPGRMC